MNHSLPDIIKYFMSWNIYTVLSGKYLADDLLKLKYIVRKMKYILSEDENTIIYLFMHLCTLPFIYYRVYIMYISIYVFYVLLFTLKIF